MEKRYSFSVILTIKMCIGRHSELMDWFQWARQKLIWKNCTSFNLKWKLVWQKKDAANRRHQTDGFINPRNRNKSTLHIQKKTWIFSKIKFVSKELNGGFGLTLFIFLKKAGYMVWKDNSGFSLPVSTPLLRCKFVAFRLSGKVSFPTPWTCFDH